MKIISFFNHKGGVSKTTTVFHLGWKLAQKGKRVLLVDADAQCNLTMIAMGSTMYGQLLKNDPSNNLKASLDSAFTGSPNRIQAPQCVTVVGMPNLFILPGHMDITAFEVQLGVASSMSPVFSTSNNLPGAFSFLLNDCASKLNLDYILVDMNPSRSAMNQIILSSSDYFIVPTSPDYFSEIAIQSMADFVPVWENWAKAARTYFSNATYPMPNIQPKFLGFTVNNYNIRNGKPTQAFASVIQNIQHNVENVLYSKLSVVGMTIPMPQYSRTLCLASISNFQHLQPKYQKYRVPVFALSNSQIGTIGVILYNHLQKRADFDAEYERFADEIIRLAV